MHYKTATGACTAKTSVMILAIVAGKIFVAIFYLTVRVLRLNLLSSFRWSL